MTGQPDDVMTLAEQPDDHAATDYSARPGNGDPHWLTSNLIRLVVVVEERGIDQVIEIHCCDVFFPGLCRVGAVGLIRQAEQQVQYSGLPKAFDRN
jgi:hypothetical protein